MPSCRECVRNYRAAAVQEPGRWPLASHATKRDDGRHTHAFPDTQDRSATSRFASSDRWRKPGSMRDVSDSDFRVPTCRDTATRRVGLAPGWPMRGEPFLRRNLLAKLGSGEENFADQVGVVIFTRFGDALTVEAQVEVIALNITPSVHRDSVALRLDRDVRAFADDSAKLHSQTVRKERLEPLGFHLRESCLTAHRREFAHRGDHLEVEIVGHQIREYSR